MTTGDTPGDSGGHPLPPPAPPKGTGGPFPPPAWPAWPSPPAWPGAPWTPPPPQQRHRVRNAVALGALVVLAASAGLWAGHVVNRDNTVTGPEVGQNGSIDAVGAGGRSLDAAAIAKKVDPGLVDVNVVLGYDSSAAAGTGMVLTSNGEVLTNNHVVDGATSVGVRDIGNGRTYSGTVVGTDAGADVAVIQLHGAHQLRTVRLDPTAVLRQGEAVLAIGNAGAAGGTPSTAAGSIVALHEAITATDETGSNPEHLTGMIESTSPIEPGDSGGPLVTSRGLVVGMDTAASQDNGFETQAIEAFSIPIARALAIAEEIVAHRASTAIEIGERGIIGVSVVSAKNDGGALVVETVPGSPAVGAGLEPGDVIVALDRHRVATAEGLTGLLRGMKPGDKVEVSYKDGSGPATTVTLRLAVGPPL